MPIFVNETKLSGGFNLDVTDSSNNNLFTMKGDNGIVLSPFTSTSPCTPLFNVGWANTGWTSFGSSGTWYKVPWTYTAGDGYYNIANYYSTTLYNFTAPWTGLYLFKMHIYIYSPNSDYNNYTHPMFWVNGSTNARRPMVGAPYRMRLYGLYGSYGNDTDCCELIYLTSGDYVDTRCYVSGSVEGYAPYSAWSGVYLGT